MQKYLAEFKLWWIWENVDTDTYSPYGSTDISWGDDKEKLLNNQKLP